MKRREFMYALGGAGVLGATHLSGFALPSAPPSCGLRIAVDDKAPSAIREAALSIAKAENHPLIGIFAASEKREIQASHKLLEGPLSERAYNHLILIGLPDDPLIHTAWQREGRETTAGFYVFGFGTLQGDIGYIESDRNLFLHSQGIKVAPFETQVVTITGNNPAGVLLAVDAFLSQGLVNGVVAAAGWSRGAIGLLDRDPLAPGFEIPKLMPVMLNGLPRIGLTQASEDEYRGVLADTSLMPGSIWRAKYFAPRAWDHADGDAAFDAYSKGLHRRAYGSTRWIAEFASDADAKHAAPKIAEAAQLRRRGDMWTGNQTYYGNKDSLGNQTPGPLVLRQTGPVVLMSTVTND